jgi:hypothetical protein
MPKQMPSHLVAGSAQGYREFLDVLESWLRMWLEYSEQRDAEQTSP